MPNCKVITTNSCMMRAIVFDCNCSYGQRPVVTIECNNSGYDQLTVKCLRCNKELGPSESMFKLIDDWNRLVFKRKNLDTVISDATGYAKMYVELVASDSNKENGK